MKQQNKGFIIPPDRFGLEMEYAGIDNRGLPVSNRDNLPLVQAFTKSLHPKEKTEIISLGNIKEEVFRHQREIVTNPGSLAETLQRATILHEMIKEIMQNRFGVFIANHSAPVAFPGGGIELLTPYNYYVESMSSVNSKGILGLVSPKSYYIQAVEKIADTQPNDFSFARNASTSSIHLHCSYDCGEHELGTKLSRNLTGILTTKLLQKNSQDILTDPQQWRKAWGMSPERHIAWSKIVATRALLGEVIDPMDKVLFEPGTCVDMDKFISQRYFGGKPRNTTECIEKNITPCRDHLMVVLKNPGGLTTELRSSDGPCNDTKNIQNTVDLYMKLIHEALSSFY